MSTHTAVVTASLAVVGFFTSSSQAGGPAYTITELAAPGGTSSQAYGISEDATVAVPRAESAAVSLRLSHRGRRPPRRSQ